MKKINLVITLLLLYSLSANAGVINILESGADPRGKVKCTDIIRQAIEKASAEGGGTIYFPAGKYLTGPIHLKSNITLYLESGAVIKFSDDFDDYLPFVKVRYEGIFIKTFSPLIYAVDVENIVIKGEGEIDGSGSTWWKAIKTISDDVRKNGQVTRPDRYQKMWIDENKEIEGLKYFKNKFFQINLASRHHFLV